MANLIGVVDFSTHLKEETPSYELIPDGTYPAVISESIRKTTKAGTGQYLQLTIELQGNQYSGRRVWDRLNLVNPSQQAVAIAHRTLNDLAIACGIDLSQEDALSDSEVLHFKPILVDVVTEKGTGGYEASNRIKRYHADATGAAPQAHRPQAPQPASSGVGPGEVPW